MHAFPCFRKILQLKMAGNESTGSSKTKRAKRQVSKETFYKWQQTYEREYQSLVWLRADMDDKDKSLVSMLCVLYVESTRLRYVGSKTSPGHGLVAPVTIRRATSSTMRKASSTNQP